jgi:Dolichyl-phosphate-mannose-protein mannosyltransferase
MNTTMNASNSRPWRALILMAYLLICIAQNAALPLFEGADEGSHFVHLNYVAEHGRLPDLNVEMPDYESAQPPLYYFMAGALIAPLDRSNAAELTRLNPDWHDTSINPNRMHDSVVNLYLPSPDADWPWRKAALAGHLARYFSALLGAVTLLCTHAISMRLFAEARARRWISFSPAPAALLAMAGVAFSSKFLYISNIISNDNGVAMFSALAILAILNRWQELRLRGALFIGLLIGCAVLTKLNGLALLAPAGWLILIQARRNTGNSPVWSGPAMRHVFRLSVCLGAGLFLVTGWWFARNVVMYGDPLGWDEVKLANTFMFRGEPLPLANMLLAPFMIIWTVSSLGNGILPQTESRLPFIVFAIIGSVAWLWRTTRSARRHTLRANLTSPFAALGLWFIAYIVLYVPWLRQYQFTEDSRLFLPLFAAMPAVLIMGWHFVLSGARLQRIQRAAALLVGGIVLVNAAMHPFTSVAKAYAAPAYLPEDKLAAFGAGERHEFDAGIGVLHAQAWEQENTVRINLVWGATQPITHSYWLNMQVLGPGDRIIAQRWVIPYNGRFSTARWKPGRFFEEEQRVPVTPELGQPQRLRLMLYPKPSEQTSPMQLRDRDTAIDLPIGNAPAARLPSLLSTLLSSMP